MDNFIEALLSEKTDKIPDEYDWFAPLLGDWDVTISTSLLKATNDMLKENGFSAGYWKAQAYKTYSFFRQEPPKRLNRNLTVNMDRPSECSTKQKDITMSCTPAIIL